jgi:hypothetical protein
VTLERKRRRHSPFLILFESREKAREGNHRMDLSKFEIASHVVGFERRKRSRHETPAMSLEKENEK